MSDDCASIPAQSASLTLQWALYYAAQGVEVFPVPPGTKAGYSDLKEEKTGRPWGASKDLKIVREMFETHPNADIGARTGAVSGMFAADIDTLNGHKHDGFASLEKLEAQHGKLPPTLRSRSPSGSEHIIFDHPGFHVPCSTGTDKKGLAPGIDIKGDGGMIILPPSGSPEKGFREWITPPDFPRAAARPWLLDWLRAQSDKKTYSTEVGTARTAPTGHRPPNGTQAARVLKDACDRVAATEGGRNTELNNQALIVGKYVGNGEIAEDVAIHDLLTACQYNGLLRDDGEYQCIATIRSGIAAGRKNPALTAAAMFNKAVVPAAVSTAGTMPLMGGMKAACDLGIPIVDAFNQNNASIPHATDAPILPIEMNATELRGPLNEAIGKMLTISRVKQRAFKFADVADVIGVLAAVHNPTVAPLIEAIRAAGARVPDGALRSAVQRFETAISAEANAQSGFILNAKGLPDPEVSENVDFLLRQMGVGLRFDEFKRQIEYSTRNTWLPYNDDEKDKIKRTANSRVYNFRASKDFIETNVRVLARENSFDSLDDLVNGLDVEWDGVPRLDSWISRACGVADDEYHRMVGRNIVGGMVARARIPGCRHDESALFIGPKQGGGKSEITKILALDDPDMLLERFDFSESDQNSLPKLAGRWVVELSELAGLGKKDAEDVKAFLTTRNDRYTAKYDTYSKDHPRRFIFCATSNDRKPLKDETGNRRFLPVSVPGEVDTVWLRANARQIIGEAARRHSLGETFGVPRALWDVAAKHQEAARQERPVEVYLRDMLAQFDDIPVQIRSADLLRALHLRGVRDNKIGEAMRKMGFVEERTSRDRFYISGKFPRAVMFHENLKGGSFSMLPSSTIPPPPY